MPFSLATNAAYRWAEQHKCSTEKDSRIRLKLVVKMAEAMVFRMRHRHKNDNGKGIIFFQPN